ncbi:MAG: segregation/condensation protein A [Firmicutes bacterium]|nr:segregation/condensation protein A [Bacillota bacterium]
MTGPLLRLEQFEGPLDLLLRLLESRQLDITEVSLAEVTDQFLAHLRGGGRLDPDQAGDFAVVAARLLALKARALLPEAAPAEAEPPAEEEGGEGVEEPPADLVEQVSRYRTFRDAAERLRAWAEARRDLIARVAPERPAPPDPEEVLQGLTLERLIDAFREVWQAAASTAREPVRVEPLGLTVRQEARRLLALARRLGSLPFSACFRERGRREAVVVTFLALLELVQLRRLGATQEAPGAEIMIRFLPRGERGEEGDGRADGGEGGGP